MFLHIVFPHPGFYKRTQLNAINQSQDDGMMRENFRIMMAVLLAHWADTKPDLTGERGFLFDLLTSEKFYTSGYNKTKNGNDERLWFCSYVGFEKVRSKWMKEKYPDVRGVLCMRIFSRDNKGVELDAHTIQIYY